MKGRSLIHIPCLRLMALSKTQAGQLLSEKQQPGLRAQPRQIRGAVRGAAPAGFSDRRTRLWFSAPLRQTVGRCNRDLHLDHNIAEGIIRHFQFAPEEMEFAIRPGWHIAV